MNERFRKMVEALHSKCEALLAMQPVVAFQVGGDLPVGGVYLFSEGYKHIYAGRTKRRIDVRIRNHFSTARDCPLAWLIAREVTGRRPTYTKAGSRAALLAETEFASEYQRAKERIRTMHVRYVHEPDPTLQALLEIYVAVTTQACYNDFDTH